MKELANLFYEEGNVWASKGEILKSTYNAKKVVASSTDNISSSKRDNFSLMARGVCIPLQHDKEYHWYTCLV
jgi:hypothetical protein